MHAIRIVDVPPGEAPLEVRQAWVGLVLPLAQRNSKAKRIPILGVATGPKGRLGMLWRLLSFRFSLMEGYEVNVIAAVDILANANPPAATWWRQNAPHLFEPWRRFVFPATCCEPTEA